jgi:hypothetical protein
MIKKDNFLVDLGAFLKSQLVSFCNILIFSFNKKWVNLKDETNHPSLIKTKTRYKKEYLIHIKL